MQAVIITHIKHGTVIAPIHQRRSVVVNTLVVINEVTLRRVRLVLGWVTACGRVNHLGMQPATQVNSAWPSLLYIMVNKDFQKGMEEGNEREWGKQRLFPK